ncbi:MAG TPA: hypothetical protein VHT26_10200 [Trebonia sp.]|nr:hypothetical protein [Trebonia sp.]
MIEGKRAARRAGKRTRFAVATATACAVAALAAGCASSSSPSSSAADPRATSSATSGATSGAAGHAFGSGGQGSNARSAPSPGGAAGTVGSVSASGFTMTTSAGQQVTVDDSSSTVFLDGTKTVSAGSIAKGTGVLVLGTANSTTITATQVIEEPAGSAYLASSAAVVPFSRGTQTVSKQTGQIPANWNEGDGTIVSGTAADEGTEAALTAYPGAVVDRVVRLSNGWYNVHFIGVNWPHHVFLNQDFQVVGAE